MSKKERFTMEFALLMKVGFIIDTVVKIGYGIAGSYVAKTAYRYYKDYKYYSEQEKAEVK